MVSVLIKKNIGGGGKGGGNGIVLKSNKSKKTVFLIFAAEIYFLL